MRNAGRKPQRMGIYSVTCVPERLVNRPRRKTRSPVAVHVRAAALVALVAYVVAGVGLLPSARQMVRWCSVVGLETGLSHERFMCEGCSCGCLSAHECWTNCCCHSLAERLAWAKANGVAVPRDVLETPEAQALLNAPSADEPVDRCCCCQAEQKDSCRADSEREPAAPSSLPSASALSCKGIAAFLVVAAPLSAFASVADLLPPVEPGRELAQDPAPVVESRALDTAKPPPRA